MLTKSTKATVRDCAFALCLAMAPFLAAGAQAGTAGQGGAGTQGTSGAAQPGAAGGVGAGQPGGATVPGAQQPGMGAGGAQTPGTGASPGGTAGGYTGTANGQIDTGYNNGGGHGSWGWLGLLGLFGLLGLRKRGHGPTVTTRDETAYQTTGTGGIR